MTVRFGPPFDTESYSLFLRTKRLPEQTVQYDWHTDSYIIEAPARFAKILGAEPPEVGQGGIGIAGHLFDYQKFIVKQALKAKRYAIWADTGLGKTAMFLEFARHVAQRTDGRVLIISPLQIISQTIEESEKFYGVTYQSGGMRQLLSKREVMAWARGRGGDGKIAITNYEKFIPSNGKSEVMNDLKHLAGVVLDESSILRSGGGKIKWALIKSCRGIEYKLSCTATPAPNDTMEYASQASFLEKLRSEGEILWTYFTKQKDGTYKVKDHAREAFYRFMAGWSVYLRSPARYGFEDNLKDVPPPEYLIEEMPITVEQLKYIHQLPAQNGQFEMFGTLTCGMVNRIKLSQIAKGFIYRGRPPRQYAHPVKSNKPGMVADIAERDRKAGHQVLVWTSFDAESDMLKRLIGGKLNDVAVLTGKTSRKMRMELIEDFRHGKIGVLITRPQMLGYGLNFQFCTSMIFSGFSDSFQDYYQAIRRCYRYGQTKSVRVHIPYVKELEGMVWDNIQQKQAKFFRDVRIMEQHYINALKYGLTDEKEVGA